MLHLVFHSVNQYLAYGSHAYQYRVDSPKCPYGSLAPSPHAADQSDDPDLLDCIPLFKEDSS